MKRLNGYLLVVALVAVGALSFAGFATAATTVALGTADSFAVLAGQHITDVPSSVITGNVGLSPAAGTFYAGLTSAEVTGTIYAVDSTGPGGVAGNNPGLLTTAKNDLTAAYVDAAGRTPSTTLAGSDNQLGGKTLTAGNYTVSHASTANIIGTLTLDAQGDPNAIFVFQSPSDLVTASGAVVALINGAQACNIFWQVTSSATLGTGTTFIGSILALTSITDNGSSTVSGRLLARNADTILNKTTITKPTCAATAATTTTTTPAGTVATTATPGLPNTGAGTSTNSLLVWEIIIPAAILVTLGSYYVIRKRKNPYGPGPEQK